MDEVSVFCLECLFKHKVVRRFQYGQEKKTRSFKNGQKVTGNKGRPSLLDNIKSLGNENFSSSRIAS